MHVREEQDIPREEEPTKWKHDRAVPYKREAFDWRKVVEQEELDDD